MLVLLLASGSADALLLMLTATAYVQRSSHNSGTYVGKRILRKEIATKITEDERRFTSPFSIFVKTSVSEWVSRSLEILHGTNNEQFFFHCMHVENEILVLHIQQKKSHRNDGLHGY